MPFGRFEGVVRICKVKIAGIRFYTNFLWQNVAECVLDDGALRERMGQSSGGEGNNIDQARLIFMF